MSIIMRVETVLNDLLEPYYRSANPKKNWYTQRNPVATAPPLDPELKRSVDRQIAQNADMFYW